MAIYFSKSTNGFYDDEIFEKTNMPSDVVQITTEVHNQMLNGQSNGKLISGDENGNPCLIDKVLSNEQLALNIRTSRDFLLQQSDWTQAFDIPQTIKDKWAIYRQQLRDIPQQSGFPSIVIFPNQPL